MTVEATDHDGRRTIRMLDPELAERIVAAVNERFDEQLAWTAELVRRPSLRTGEAGAQDLIEAALAEAGFDIDRWVIDSPELRAHPGYGPTTVDPGTLENVVGTWRPPVERGRSLILNGHVDVVPTGPDEYWTRSPWDASVVDGWLHGRGSADMKAGIGANLFALGALTAAGLRPTGRIHVQSVVEEECTGNGSLAALLRGYTADACVIPEPEDDKLVRANVGVLWFDVKVRGVPAHLRVMDTGQNAIDAAYTVMNDLRELEAEWNRRKDGHRYFEDTEHPINFNFGVINGGDWPSSVPAQCTFTVRAAFYPGTPAAEAWAEIQEVLAKSAARFDLPDAVVATPSGFFAEGYVLEEGSEAEGVLARAHQRVFGSELESFTTPGYLDGRVFTLYGNLPCLVYGPVSEAIHGIDERVEVESIRRITTAIALFTAEWCGVEPRS
ncbi:ArgE/DapE family deacylase [Amycolatopsis sp. 195334CR]|uniref:ArgE/DapE family deacylase n=1 Tax=Amycolatopsis sp. 195334CR TaxID=2814588 RepID=UPI001A8F93DC|nr:ArgE/DapE family deacylase [Amycolatopsis sp. 195334CR]MBN6039018.1 ArgE/DapE family deacylase [Amycolatopsis sp. 195334CR]